MAGTIGIKQANGAFYSIMKENSPQHRRLVLTTAFDNQKMVQIDLYKSELKSMADAMYIGTIVVENIDEAAKGSPSIELSIRYGDDGSITAAAVDLRNPSNEYQLNVSLQSFEDDGIEYPDFDADTEQPAAPPEKGCRAKRLVVIGLVVVFLCAGAWFLYVYGRSIIQLIWQFMVPFLPGQTLSEQHLWSFLS